MAKNKSNERTREMTLLKLCLIHANGRREIVEFDSAPKVFRLPIRSSAGWTSKEFIRGEDLVYREKE